MRGARIFRVANGDIFKAPCEALVNPVNCVGISGKGLAKEFKKRFPDAFIEYARACKAGDIKIGAVFATPANKPAPSEKLKPPFVVHFPTKQHWRDDSFKAYITEGLVALRLHIMEARYRTIAIPALGCGNGGLEWSWVGPTIEDALQNVDAEVYLYEPIEGK